MIASIAKNLARNWIEASDGQTYVARFEQTKRFRSIAPISLSFDGGLFFVEEDGFILAVARKSRLHYQFEGFEHRRRTLQKEYCITDGIVRPGDLVIDCGANIGEFSIICAQAGAQVIAFEPDRIEFKALQRNSEKLAISPFQQALWNENGTMEFFDGNDSGDSSLLDPGDSRSSYEVETLRLDSASEVPDLPIRLIKLEAEGAEPEILDGMRKTLERTQFVTVDMGAERGVRKDNTVVDCTEALYDRGFRMRAFFPPRCIALFEKVKD